MGAIDPWQTSGITAVEAVELCSRPLSFRWSCCVQFLVASGGNGCPGLLKCHLRYVKLSRHDLNLFEPFSGLSQNFSTTSPTAPHHLNANTLAQNRTKHRITGQDGSYLAQFLLEKDYQVHGIKRRASSKGFRPASQTTPAGSRSFIRTLTRANNSSC